MKRLPALLAVAAAVGATACSTGPRTPDEFRVVRKAPLTVPPDFNLRPPSPGASRPQDLQPDVQARVAVFGTDLGQTATEGEKLFVRALGGEATDRTVRAAVDFDSAQIVRKNRSFADAILSFGRPVATAEPVVDAAAEAERLRSEQEALAEVTGGGQVMIRRRASGKLPGL